jgi:hypothetical protein
MSTDQDLRLTTKAGKAHVANLDAMGYEDLVAVLGQPDRMTTIMREGGRRWQPGLAKPSLANSDPAVTQAMARCITFRAIFGTPTTDFGSVLNEETIHPKVCAFCDYPLEELEAAVDWGGWESSLVQIEYVTWDGRLGSQYSRETPRQGTYGDPRWANFYSQAPSRSEAGAFRTRAIAAAMYGEQEA